MYIKMLLYFFIFLLFTSPLMANENPISYTHLLNLTPSIYSPQTEQDQMKSGMALQLGYQFYPSLFKNFYFELSGGAWQNTSALSEDKFRFFPLGFSALYHYPLHDSLFATVKAGGGFYLLQPPTDQVLFNYFTRASLGLTYQLTDFFYPGIEGSYTSFHDPKESITAWNISLSLGIALSTFEKDVVLTLKETKINDLFSANYTRYYEDAIGTITVENSGKLPIENIELSFYIRNYMASPTPSRIRVPLLLPGEKRGIPLYAFFDKNIKYLTADTQTLGEITLQYKNKKGKIFTQSREVPVKIYHRNALTWDDLNKLGSFIQPENKEVLDFSRKALQLFDADTRLPKNLQNALKIFLALQAHGLQYVSDPKSSYNFIPGARYIMDYIQYPRETLQKKTGDCDDFSVLYASLLESIGIETAIVTLSNHVFVLFHSPEKLPGLTLSLFGKSWVPVDITLLNKSFLEASEKALTTYQQEKFTRVKTSLEMMSEYHPVVLEDPISVYTHFQWDEMAAKYEAETQKLLNFLKKPEE